MTRTRLIIATAVAALAATALLLGGVLRESSPEAATAAFAGAQAAEDFKAGFSLNASTASLVADLQSRLRADPQDEHSYTLLGLAYQQRARETGDPSWYSKSEGVLRRALTLDSKDYLAVSGLGSLALSRHRFRAALTLGEQARDLNPYSARPVGVIGDALVELGRYREAFHAFDTMNRLRPSLSSYARVSYGRELIGHTAAAIKAMKLAVDAASGAAEPTAWTHVQLGKLYFGHGRIAHAEREYRFALRIFPGYPYGLDALAQAVAARGDYRSAIALERRAVEAIPLPQYVAALGDLYRVTGRSVLARRQYALIGAIERLLHANGVKTDLEIALFQVDHGIALRHALARARVARAERPSIDGDDVLAWALARNRRCAEALPHSRAALRLGTQDAVKFFHRAMIERCLGHSRQSREWLGKALALNPHFSLIWAPVAKRLAR
jgi:tetratricopeptide (TPR) repeat protein